MTEGGRNLLIDLQTTRRAALERCLDSIQEMQAVLAGMPGTAPERKLVRALLRRLHGNADRLAHGIQNVKATTSCDVPRHMDVK